MRSMLLPSLFWAGFFLLAGQATTAAVSHPMDPLTADEMLGAANLLLQRGAAQPGAVFQSIELREPTQAGGAERPSRRRRGRTGWRPSSIARTSAASRRPST